MSTAQYAAMTAEQAARFMPDPPPQLARKRLAELVAGRPVVDVGCGRAEEIGDLYQPDQYVGVDCSLELVKLCRHRWPGYTFEVCRAQNLPLMAVGTVAIMKAVLEHVPAPEALDIYQSVRRACRVLYLCWHWEPSDQPKMTWYDGELGRMEQNRHLLSDFAGILEREVVGNHVIWTVEGLL